MKTRLGGEVALSLAPCECPFVLRTRKKSPKEARDLIGAAKTPPRAKAHLDLGRAYQARGLYDDAIRELEQAVQLEPSSLDARIALAELRGLRGHAASA